MATVLRIGFRPIVEVDDSSLSNFLGKGARALWIGEQVLVEEASTRVGGGSNEVDGPVAEASGISEVCKVGIFSDDGLGGEPFGSFNFHGGIWVFHILKPADFF